MAYNRVNYLKRIIEIQDITIDYQKTGATQLWIYEHIIKDRYLISFSTYNNYLCVPSPRTQLKNITC